MKGYTIAQTTSKKALKKRKETIFKLTQNLLKYKQFADKYQGVKSSNEIQGYKDTTKPYGSGLGLALASRIVADHGGTIRAEPCKPRGTKVTVMLPVAQPSAETETGKENRTVPVYIDRHSG